MRLVKCRICRTPYEKKSLTHRACSPTCALELAKQDREKKERKTVKARKVEIRSRREWMKIAQSAFNAYIRKRDESCGCISCGRVNINHSVGGSWDCGHYLTVGAYPELRFDESNANKQCKVCNGGSGRFTRKGHTVAAEYRERLVAKIGLKEVERLEGSHEPKKYSISDLQEIIKTYKAKLKELL